ncbi:hypothetical protein PHYBOEH_008503 [Phytophthora boehmeriae]|uniref:Uncharacterized protein n=1 Tax=Phytophthora boehmeriae TaxID=109152 RepID=A0A8T1X734_9STRA|nr:hypothetical protein PHYBOEH_008503 [Phytophthora boehmeriae]
MAGCEVDASLSAFTSGFVSELVPVQVITGSTALVVKEPNIVASSLSTFTAGYTGQGVGESVNSISAVDASISNFTYGYTVVENTGTATTHQSIDVPVDISLSTFTSGYGNQKPSAVVVSSPGVQSQAGLVKASLSAFTAGYCAEVSPMSTKMDSDVRPDTKSTDLQDPSPSGFTLDDSIKVGDVKLSVNGQPTSTIEITPEKLSDRLESPGVEDIPEAVATSVSSGLNQSLEDATTALEEVFALHKPEDNADSKLQEIHRLITALRASVNDFIVPDKT